MIAKLHAQGVRNVILTGVSFNDAELGSAISDGKSIVYDFNPRLTRMSHGTGDVFASVILGGLVNGKPLAEAVRTAVTFVSHAVARAEAMEIPTTDGLPFEEILNELW